MRETIAGTHDRLGSDGVGCSDVHGKAFRRPQDKIKRCFDRSGDAKRYIQI